MSLCWCQSVDITLLTIRYVNEQQLSFCLFEWMTKTTWTFLFELSTWSLKTCRTLSAGSANKRVVWLYCLSWLKLKGHSSWIKAKGHMALFMSRLAWPIFLWFILRPYCPMWLVSQGHRSWLKTKGHMAFLWGNWFSDSLLRPHGLIWIEIQGD